MESLSQGNLLGELLHQGCLPEQADAEIQLSQDEYRLAPDFSGDSDIRLQRG